MLGYQGGIVTTRRRNRYLHLGGQRIKLIWRSQVMDGKQCLDGKWDPNASTISISKDQAPQLIAETLIHECLHAVSDEFDLKLTERKVGLIAKGLADIIKPFLRGI